MNTFKKVVVSLSGGMDSSTLLLRSIKEVGANNVTALSFYYGQKHKVELEKAQELIDYLATKGYNIKYQVVRLDGLAPLLSSALVEGGEDVPEGHYAESNMKETVVPNRNKIFASITQAVALSVANDSEQPTAIALGIHAGDHDVYPDCRQEFRDADDAAFRLGNWDSERVSYFTPYLKGDKYDILLDGQNLCDKLNLDFNDVYSRTNTSYKPILIGDTWYADYFSSSSVERIEAFIKLDRKDPARYADETGPVTWEVAKKHAQDIIADYNKNTEGKNI